MFIHVEEAKYLNDYKIELLFNDGVKGVADLSGKLSRGIFLPLRDMEKFRQVSFSKELGTIYWPNGADLAPESLYKLVTGHYPSYVTEPDDQTR